MKNLSEPISKTNGAGSEPAVGIMQSWSEFLIRPKVAVIWSLLAGAATYLFLVDPATENGYPPCLFRSLTGWQCPGCGSTRALHQLMHGHPIVAFELNPLLLISLPFIVFVLLRLSGSSPIGGNRTDGFPASVGWLALTVVIGFWVFRNTPFYPFVS